MADRDSGSTAATLLRPFAELRPGEASTALLMFSYSFLAMTSYNIIQPITRSKFISDLGAENIPYVQFVSGLLIGLIMQGYAKATGFLPQRWVIPAAQAGLVVILVVFWMLFQTGQEWVSAGFYLLGQIFALLLISQFWTLANAIYDPRQAKRIFGFIGGGSVLGGMTGAGITSMIATAVGTNTLVLWSAFVLALCIGISIIVLRRESHAVAGSGVDDERGLGFRESVQLFLESRQIRLISVVIAFGALGAVILDQQLNMAAEVFKGRGETDSLTAFLAGVRFWVSAAGLVIQMFLTSRIHRLLGVAFALMILPVGLGSMAAIVLLNAALWAPSVSSVIDRSVRYTVDKTTREILFLPLPTALKLRAKPFVDVTVDRVAKGLGALCLLVLIKDWGLDFDWQQLSYATLGLVAVWLVMAVYAKREYVASFRRSLAEQGVKPAEIRLDTADLNTIEALVGELSHPEPRRVVYAIELLESLDKRHLVTPLLLHHESPEVRARALAVASSVPAERSEHWLRGVERALKDQDGDVRLAAVRALAALKRSDAAEIMRPYLQHADPQLVVTAACALAESAAEADRRAAEEALHRLSSDTREQAAPVRLQIARALGQVQAAQFRPLLVPLMFDTDLSVAREAINSAGRLGAAAGDFLFVPPLISLMRHRLLKSAARQVLVSYGENVIDALTYFMRDKDEDIWIRRHVPSTLALIPTQRSLDILVETLQDADGFMRYKAGAAIDRIRRARPDLTIDRAVVERQILQEATRAFNALTLHHNLFVSGGLDGETVLGRVLREKQRRAFGRVFRLLGLIFSPDDIGAVQKTLSSPDARLRAGATEYLDNLLSGEVRRKVMLLVEDLPPAERVRKGNVTFKTRTRDVEDTLAQLVYDDEQVVAAAAIHLIEQRGLWVLSDDLEHTLANRDPHDWYVFEAASWALAASRMPADRRRVLWLEPLPAVELVNRLRANQLFEYASIDELFRIASLGRQVRHEPGRVLYEAGRAAESLQFILDGRVTVTSEDGTPSELTTPAVLALDAVLEGSPMRTTVRATETTITLSLTTDEFLSLLSENVEIAQGIFRMLIDTRGQAEWHTVLHGELPKSLVQKPDAGSQPFERVLLLQSSPLLARATASQLLGLAAIGRPVTLTKGSDPMTGAEPSIVVVLTGAVRVERDGQEPQTADPGDSIGIYETLSGVPSPVRAEVVTDGVALRFVRSELFDLLADNIDLLQGIFSGLMRHGAFNKSLTSRV